MGRCRPLRCSWCRTWPPSCCPAARRVPSHRCQAPRPAYCSCPAHRRESGCPRRRLAPKPGRQAAPRWQPRSLRFSPTSFTSPKLIDDEQFGDVMHRPPLPDLPITQTNESRTAHAPCKLRGVVFVQGFQGNFAKPWPRTVLICGAIARSRFRGSPTLFAPARVPSGTLPGYNVS